MTPIRRRATISAKGSGFAERYRYASPSFSAKGRTRFSAPLETMVSFTPALRIAASHAATSSGSS